MSGHRGKRIPTVLRRTIIQVSDKFVMPLVCKIHQNQPPDRTNSSSENIEFAGPYEYRPEQSPLVVRGDVRPFSSLRGSSGSKAGFCDGPLQFSTRTLSLHYFDHPLLLWILCGVQFPSRMTAPIKCLNPLIVIHPPDSNFRRDLSPEPCVRSGPSLPPLPPTFPLSLCFV
jgi:hypothetical protein